MLYESWELSRETPRHIGSKITPLRQRDPTQRFLSTSVGRSLIDDDEDDDDDDDDDDEDDDDVDDVEAERTRVRMMKKVLRL